MHIHEPKPIHVTLAHAGIGVPLRRDRGSRIINSPVIIEQTGHVLRGWWNPPVRLYLISSSFDTVVATSSTLVVDK